MSLLVKLVEGLATLYGASLGRVFPHRVILCYHNVGTPGMPRRGWLDDARLIDTRDFAAQIDWLQRHCELLSLDDLLAARTARKTQVAITFDDGYYNNLSEVLPIMRERKAPMTWFVATAFVDEPGRLPWWDLLDLVTARDNLKLTLREAGVAGDYDLSRAADRERLRQAVRRTMKVTPAERGRAILDELHAQLRGQFELPRNAFARAEEIAGVDFDGLQFGGHTNSHPNLAGSDEAAQLREIETGKQRLEAMSGQQLRWFAYPFGGPGSFDDSSVRMVEQAGFDGALTLLPGLVTRGVDRYRIPRIGVSPGQSLSAFRARVGGAPVYIAAARLRRLLS